MVNSFSWQPGLFAPRVDPTPAPMPPVPPTPSAEFKPLSLCVLGSGSGGNCSVVRWDGRLMLIDLGLGTRVTLQRLEQIGAAISDVAGVCLTHLDQDHYRPTWWRTLLKCRVPVYVHRWHRRDLLRTPGGEELEAAGLVHPFDADPFSPIPGVRVHAIPLPHDDQGTFGYHVRTPGGSLGYATDLGHVPDELIDRFTASGGVDLLAIESNYDPQMQLTSSRPWFLKKRIMGTHGHLSNEQAFDTVRQIIDRCSNGSPQHVVLLHRSDQCNSAEVIMQVFNQDPRIARRVHLSHHRRRTPWFTVHAPGMLTASQMPLGFA